MGSLCLGSDISAVRMPHVLYRGCVLRVLATVDLETLEPDIIPSYTITRQLRATLWHTSMRRNFTPSCSWDDKADCQKNVVC